MNNFLLVFLGGGVGACLRYGIGLGLSLFMSKLWISTLICNLIGCALIFLFKGQGLLELKREFLIVGLLGGLTTFSTFSFEMMEAFINEEYLELLCIFGLNILGAVFAGAIIFRYAP